MCIRDSYRTDHHKMGDKERAHLLPRQLRWPSSRITDRPVARRQTGKHGWKFLLFHLHWPADLQSYHCSSDSIRRILHQQNSIPLYAGVWTAGIQLCICGRYIHQKDIRQNKNQWLCPVSYTHLRAHETGRNLVCRLLLEKKKKTTKKTNKKI